MIGAPIATAKVMVAKRHVATSVLSTASTIS